MSELVRIDEAGLPAPTQGEIVDDNAIHIGELYVLSRTSVINSVLYAWECGQELAKKKASLSHGEWTPWIKNNAGTLGFDSDRTAQRLIRLWQQNPTLTSDSPTIAPRQALQLSCKLWGNETAHVSHNSGNNEWYTPENIIEAAYRAMGGIDLDPASSETANSIVNATHFFSIEDNGLEQEWHGRVWLNPPYAQPHVTEFSEAVAVKFETCEIKQACVLVNNATETDWFQRMALVSAAICFPRTRVKFLDETLAATGAPLQGQAIIYMGENSADFRSVFSEFGFIR